MAKFIFFLIYYVLQKLKALKTYFSGFSLRGFRTLESIDYYRTFSTLEQADDDAEEKHGRRREKYSRSFSLRIYILLPYTTVQKF